MKMSKLPDFQQTVEILIDQLGGYWPPLSMLASVVEEIGELSRLLNRIEGFKPNKANERIKGIDEELGDIMFSIICLANSYKIDLSQALINTIDKYAKRDYTRFHQK